MKRRSFTFTVFVGTVLLMGLIMALSGGVSYVHLNRRALERDRAQDERLLGVLREFFAGTWNQSDAQLDRQVKALMQGLPTRLTLIDADGRVRADSEADPLTMSNHKTPSRPEVIGPLTEGVPGTHVRTSSTLDREFRYMARPVQPAGTDGPVLGVVRLATPVQTITESGEFIWHALAWSTLAALPASVVLGLLVSLVWSRPLRQTANVARRLAAGDLTARATITGSREAAELSAALNEMRCGIQAQIELIAAQRENLQTVVANLREGVIALDEQGHILFMNPAAAGILAVGSDTQVGRHVQTVVRVPEIIDALGAVDTQRTVSRQFESHLGGRTITLNIRADALPNVRPEGIRTLLVVHDVTAIAHMAAVKSEFVANASHELRTPLATLRAVADSLATIEPDDRESLARFTAMLDRHLRRLENMTTDLLDLHMVEQARRRLDLQEIELGAVAQWVRTQFNPPAADKGVELLIEAPEAPMSVRTDRRLLELIVQNLLDNAIKFTPPAGHVRCQMETLGEQVRFTVRDTGCGIAPELQERVFERFFQADSSRSGDARVRGTGLGLAIVKYAAERLSAKVSLVSRPGRGTTVTVTLPGSLPSNTLSPPTATAPRQ